MEHFINWQQDPYNNSLARLVFPEKTQRFEVEVDLVAELSATNPFDYFLEPEAESYPFQYSEALAKDLWPYLAWEPAGELLQNFLYRVPREKRPTIGFLVELNRQLNDEVSYVARLDPGIQSCEETLGRRSGSCRDSAWLLVQVLRHLGLAARFVSGYLIQLAPDRPQAEGSATTDSVDLHAWAEVYLPGAGWIGFDPTSGLLATEGHIPLACTPDVPNASPLTGSVEPCKVDFSYSMSLDRVNHNARVAKPYTDAQWKRIEELGRKVDADLHANDVRLTMGGEPTFVGIDEPDSPQWNQEALGPQKRERAVRLIRKIQEAIAPGALLHFGQGKWYPGEYLPRWALGCYWRADGIPVWENGNLIAPEDAIYNFDRNDALQFMEALTRRLQVSSKNILPVYEDVLYHLWDERPARADAEPAGYVLPIRRRQVEGRLYWSSQLWFSAPERLVLLQGDSPIGYRLRIETLSWVEPDDIEDDPRRDKLPLHPAHRMDLFNAEAGDDPLPAESTNRDSSVPKVRPALCVEVRQGRLHIFLPHTSRLPDYLDLLSAVEDTCLYLNKPVWIEGYPPPRDPRMRSFSVTPDPGVIEVNLPPASNWEELEQINTLVFDKARESRLTAEKFMHDGKHLATGGGNHIVIGGQTTADSPLLRRPDLLRSMLTFWQNHPALSYLFSGRFVGPTSQYPRVDEARMDALYELEIAFAQIPSGECDPQIVDRLFRNLLVDMTGNTHRAEFCIDKLYPPEGSGPQLGLLELRAFEMSPHVRMGLAQSLLIRALVAMFWAKPYENRMVRWGTTLHDRFLLPYFIRQDLGDLLAALRPFGYDFDERWFAPHIEFRFPKIGSIAIQGLQLELRQAIEPWHVLGEEASSAGTSRSVDSSLERLQVKVSGLTESRYAVTCNGRRVPLHPTGTPGEAVAGVRFRAWLPVSCLHPTIPVQAPLVFNIVDLWGEHSIGSCTYYAQHPSGHWYSERPADASQAETRRSERFQAFAPTTGYEILPEEELNPSFPMTLDMRWPAPGGVKGDGAASLS